MKSSSYLLQHFIRYVEPLPPIWIQNVEPLPLLWSIIVEPLPPMWPKMWSRCLQCGPKCGAIATNLKNNFGAVANLEGLKSGAVASVLSQNFTRNFRFLQFWGCFRVNFEKKNYVFVITKNSVLTYQNIVFDDRVPLSNMFANCMYRLINCICNGYRQCWTMFLQQDARSVNIWTTFLCVLVAPFSNPNKIKDCCIGSFIQLNEDKKESHSSLSLNPIHRE